MQQGRASLDTEKNTQTLEVSKDFGCVGVMAHQKLGFSTFQDSKVSATRSPQRRCWCDLRKVTNQSPRHNESAGMVVSLERIRAKAKG